MSPALSATLKLLKGTGFSVGDYEKNVQGGETLFDVEGLTDAKQQAIQELGVFLDELARREQDETLRKAAQYNNIDLQIVGQTMATLLGIEAPDERTAMQLGCAFFMLGKVARIVGAIAGGSQPVADSWYDARIYGTMGLKIWETGRWT